MTRVARRLAQRIFRRPLILAYHRIAEVPRDPMLLAVTPEHFEQHLDVLARRTSPTALTNVAHGLSGGRPTRGAVTVTFDDGYVDNLTNARPLLAAAGVPATVFVTTGALGATFWWDDLERMLFEPAALPASLRLNFQSVSREWTLDETAPAPDGDSWNVLDAPRSTRQRLYTDLHALLRPMRPGMRDVVLAELRRWSAHALDATKESRSMTGDELVDLIEGNLLAVGAHTARHPVLAALPAADQAKEISESRDVLTEILGEPPVSFAYPYGGSHDYTVDTVAILRELGFSQACTTVPGVVSADAVQLELPRFLVRDWDGDEFERRLLSSFHV